MKNVRFHHLLALGSVLWLATLLSAPPLHATETAFQLTVTLIAVNFLATTWVLLRKAKVLLFLVPVQLALFCVLNYQVFCTYGSHNFHYKHDPRFYDWIEFTAVHALQAVDILDILTEYGINLQHISHASTLSGIIVVFMHCVVDIALIGLLVKWVSKRWKRTTKNPETAAKSQETLWMLRVLGLTVFICIVYPFVALFQGWRVEDVFIFWPLDNILRAVDVGDLMQVFHWRIHRVESGFWADTIAIIFRGLIWLWLTARIRLLCLTTMRGVGLTLEDRIEALEQGSRWVDMYDELFDGNAAAKALGNLGADAKPAVPSLIHVLGDVHSCVRVAAAAALEKIDPAWRESETAEVVYASLIQALSAGNGEAARRLGYFGANAVPILIQELAADHNWGCSELASEALGRIGPQAKAGVPVLVQALTRCHTVVPINDAAVRKAAAEALANIGPEAGAAIPALVQALGNRMAVVSKAACVALDRINPTWRQSEAARQAVPVLVQALADADESLREAAARALDTINRGWRQSAAAKTAMPALVQALTQPDPDIRRAAAKALGNFGSDAVPALLQASADRDPRVRLNAVKALGEIALDGTPGLPPLIQLLADEIYWVREAATEALGKIGPLAKPAIPSLIRSLADQSWSNRNAAAQALKKIDSSWRQSEAAKTAVPALVQSLAHKNFEIRAAAVEALGEIGPQAEVAVPALVKTLKTLDQTAAAKALGKIGPAAKVAVPALVEALTEAKRSVKRDWFFHDKASTNEFIQSATDALTRIEGRKGVCIYVRRLIG